MKDYQSTSTLCTECNEKTEPISIEVGVEVVITVRSCLSCGHKFKTKEKY